MVACINVEGPIVEYTYNPGIKATVTVDITTYIQVIAFLIMAANVLSLSFAGVALVILELRALRMLKNIGPGSSGIDSECGPTALTEIKDTDTP